MIASICAPAPDFNPRSYKRSDCYYSYTAPFMDISIHAPTRGATGLHPLFISVMRISIHAPTRGATLGGNMDNMIGQNFNPRSYKRSDLSDLPPFAPPDISIHAPTRGATYLIYHLSLLLIFQSTLLQEERPI